MSDNFERLLPEIMLMVMEELPDLEALHALICASPTAKALFDNNPSPIINRLVEKSMPAELHRYVRWIAIMHSEPAMPDGPYSTEPSSLGNFIQHYRSLGGTETHVPPLVHGLRGTKGPRAVLVSAVLVQRLHNAVLYNMLERLCSLEDGHPPSPTIMVNSQGTVTSMNIIPVSEESFFAWASWTPSWVERFRVKEAI